MGENWYLPRDHKKGLHNQEILHEREQQHAHDGEASKTEPVSSMDSVREFLHHVRAQNEPMNAETFATCARWFLRFSTPLQQLIKQSRDIPMRFALAVQPGQAHSDETIQAWWAAYQDSPVP
jgi:hypothetical protein